jgi:hypothetical protein
MISIKYDEINISLEEKNILFVYAPKINVYDIEIISKYFRKNTKLNIVENFGVKISELEEEINDRFHNHNFSDLFYTEKFNILSKIEENEYKKIKKTLIIFNMQIYGGRIEEILIELMEKLNKLSEKLKESNLYLMIIFDKEIENKNLFSNLNIKIEKYFFDKPREIPQEIINKKLF